MPSLATRLHLELAQAGIPITGVSGEGLDCRVDFAPGATQTDRADAAVIVANFDRTTRRPRSYAAIMADIASLSAADRAKLMAAIAAHFLRTHPQFASTFDVAVEGEELDV